MEPLSMMALLGLASTALSAGGGVAGGLLSGKPKERTATQLPSSNPANAAAVLALMARLGIAMPSDELLLQASPLNQALNRRFATPVSRESRRRILRASNAAVENYLAARQAGDTRSADEIFAEMQFQGDERRAVERAAQEGGFTTVGGLLDAEFNFRQQVPTITGQFRSQADAQRGLQNESIAQQRAALEAFASGTDIATLRGLERDRLLRDFDDQRTSILAAANASGSNPARGLELLDRQRQDIDLTALQRAVSLATGEAGVASARAETARNLDPSLVALGVAPNFSSPASLLGMTQSQPNQGPATAAQSGLGAAGQGLGNLGLLQLLLQNQGPGATT